MKKLFKVLIFSILVAATTTSFVYAKPEDNPIFPTNGDVQIWLQNLEDSIRETISDLPDYTNRILDLETLMSNLSNSIDDLLTRIGLLEDEVELLTEQVDQNTEDIENSLGGSAGGITVVNFATYQPKPYTSDWISVSGYSSIIINLASTYYAGRYYIDYTDNPLDTAYTEQLQVSCGGMGTCPATQVELLGDYYRIRIIGSGHVTATGYLQ